MVVWLFTWSWDADEHVVLALWVCSIVAGFARDRWWNRHGVIVALLLGCALPPAGYLACHFIVGLVWHVGSDAVRQWLLFTLVVLAFCGGTSAAIAVLFLRFMRWIAGSGSRMRSVAFAGLGIVALALAGVGVLVFRAPPAWMPILVIPPIDVQGYDPYLPYAISDDGRFLAIGQSPPLQTSGGTGWLRIWSVESGREITPPGLKTPLASALCLSPDGRMLAIVHGGISIYDTASGRLIESLQNPGTHIWAPQPCRFSPDGKSLVMCTADMRDRRVFVWNTTDWQLLKEQRLSKPSRPVIAKGRLWL
ncbi:MAG TPA: WD40 repeat domain-containing protein, partial [Pirellulaceae bacterium]|nr:WD40 repeat domain-containing protein [Pirellulaceae bacterium]